MSAQEISYDTQLISDSYMKCGSNGLRVEVRWKSILLNIYF